MATTTPNLQALAAAWKVGVDNTRVPVPACTKVLSLPKRPTESSTAIATSMPCLPLYSVKSAKASHLKRST